MVLKTIVKLQSYGFGEKIRPFCTFLLPRDFLWLWELELYYKLEEIWTNPKVFYNK